MAQDSKPMTEGDVASISVGAGPEVKHRLGIRTWLSIGAIIYQYVISLGAFTIIVPIIPQINQAVGPSPDYSWMASAWSVATAIGVITAGSISDIFGRRWVVVPCGAVGVLSGIIGVTAKSVPGVMGAMIVLGLNQAGTLVSYASVAELVPNKTRPYVLGIMNFGAAGFVICGSLIGHELVLHTGSGWRTAFWIVLAANIPATILTLFLYHPEEALAARNHKRVELLKQFDYVGLVGVIAGSLLFLIGITYVPQYGAQSARFIAPFVTGCVLLVALVFWEVYGTEYPLLHPYLFKRMRSFTAQIIVAWVGGMLFYGLQALWPIFCANVWEGDDLRAIGIDGMTLGAGSQVGGVGFTLLFPILGPIIGSNWMLAIGAALQAIFFPLLAIVGPNDKSMALAFSFFGSVGVGVSELLTITLVQLAAPDEWIGFATSVLGLLRTMGGAVGIAIYSAIMQSRASTVVPGKIAEAVLPAGLPPASLPAFIEVLMGAAPATQLSTIPGLTPEILQSGSTAAKEGWLAAFQYIWYASIAFGICGVIAALYSKDISPKLTSHVAQHLKTERIETDALDNSEKINTEHLEAHD